MPDLNLDVNYFEHPKTVRLTGLLGRGAEVLPIKLWAYCGKVHAESGRLANYSTRELESVIGWWGSEGSAAAALIKVGFLTEIGEPGEGFEASGWLEHEGHLAAFKVRSRKANEARWAEAREGKESARTPSRSPKDEVKDSSNLPTDLLHLPGTEAHAPPARAAAFKPPTLEEVKAYCVERKNSVDAQRWMNHYTSNGWMVGRTKMKDWRAAVRTWESGQSSQNGRERPSSRPVAGVGKYDKVGEHHELI